MAVIFILDIAKIGIRYIKNRLLYAESPCVCGLEMVVVLRTVDYHGEARSTGGDPVTAAATLDDSPLPCTVTDLDTGLYRYVAFISLTALRSIRDPMTLAS